MKRTLLALALILAGTGATAAQGYDHRYNRAPGFDRHGPAVFVPPYRPYRYGYHRFHRHHGWHRPWHRRMWW